MSAGEGGPGFLAFPVAVRGMPVALHEISGQQRMLQQGAVRRRGRSGHEPGRGQEGRRRGQRVHVTIQT